MEYLEEVKVKYTFILINLHGRLCNSGQCDDEAVPNCVVHILIISSVLSDFFDEKFDCGE